MPQPSVVFIDDSATMREVIKIAFRRENFDVFAFADPNTALDHMEKNPPDILITDVIMPDHDGYQVCEYVKQHPTLAPTPVILMSGVVNRDVAEKAFGVKAAELVRKPFQPQDLITRVKQLLRPPAATSPTPAAPAEVLSAIFAASKPKDPESTKPTAPVSSNAPSLARQNVPAPSAGGDITKLKVELLRLEGLVKKLQAELGAEREYASALEDHIKSLQETRCNAI